MIFSAGRRAACSNSSGVLTWHRAGWKQLTPASTSALPLLLQVVLPPAHRQTLQPLLMDPQVTRVCQMGTNPPPQNCLGADWFLWKGLIGFYNDISTVQMSYKKKELLLLLMIISGETPRTLWRKPLLLGWFSIRWNFHWMGTEDVISGCCCSFLGTRRGPNCNLMQKVSTSITFPSSIPFTDLFCFFLSSVLYLFSLFVIIVKSEQILLCIEIDWNDCRTLEKTIFFLYPCICNNEVCVSVFFWFEDFLLICRLPGRGADSSLTLYQTLRFWWQEESAVVKTVTLF